MPGFAKRNLKYPNPSKNIEDQRNAPKDQRKTDIITGLEEAGWNQPGPKTIAKLKKLGKDTFSYKEFIKEYGEDKKDQMRARIEMEKKNPPQKDWSGSLVASVRKRRLMSKDPVAAPDDLINKGFSKKNKPQYNTVAAPKKKKLKFLEPKTVKSKKKK